MTNKILSILWLGAGMGATHSFAATVAQMSGTVFTSQQFSQPQAAGMSQPMALAVFGGVALLFATLFRRRNA